MVCTEPIHNLCFCSMQTSCAAKHNLHNVWQLIRTLVLCSAQILASMSTRRVGRKLQGSVLSSLTALSGAVEGLDKNMDYIFEEVFGREFLNSIVNLDFDDFL